MCCVHVYVATGLTSSPNFAAGRADSTSHFCCCDLCRRLRGVLTSDMCAITLWCSAVFALREPRDLSNLVCLVFSCVCSFSSASCCSMIFLAPPLLTWRCHWRLCNWGWVAVTSTCVQSACKPAGACQLFGPSPGFWLLLCAISRSQVPVLKARNEAGWCQRFGNSVWAWLRKPSRLEYETRCSGRQGWWLTK